MRTIMTVILIGILHGTSIPPVIPVEKDSTVVASAEVKKKKKKGKKKLSEKGKKKKKGFFSKVFGSK